MSGSREQVAEFATSVVARLPDAARSRFTGAVAVQPTDRKEFGDFSSNLCFRLATKGFPPKELAKLFVAEANRSLPAFLAKVEERNGFINFFLQAASVLDVVAAILEKGERYGASASGAGRKVLVEFVSANPTGPLTIAHGRQAAVGEALVRILSFAGYAASREYYLNDSGRQMNLLGQSLKARYDELRGIAASLPEDGYRGAYLVDIAKTVPAGAPDDPDWFRKFACDVILRGIRQDLEDFGVVFDTWTNESAFHESGRVKETLELLKAKDLAYFQDGAWWFRATAFGDDKDRVVVKSDGAVTYLMPDIVYHRDKISRGYGRLIDLLGPDHHGYVPRLKGAVAALGLDPESIQVIIVQLTTLYRGEEKLRMSTRAGEFITLRELMDEVGADAAKFFLLYRRAESPLDFDLEVAKKKSLDNPVYYLQYAYVRLLHILEFAKEKGYAADGSGPVDLSPLAEETERELARKLAQFPDLIERLGRTLEAHLLAEYLLVLAQAFHSYYHDHRIVTDDKPLSEARLALVRALLVVFSSALRLLNISLPEKM